MDEEKRKATQQLLKEAFSTKVMAETAKASKKTGFASDMSALAFENAFANVWTRPELDRRARSLVTLGILIALRATDELRIHFATAIANGCTIAELEEVIYQSSIYAGFPAANAARAQAVEALLTEGLIKEDQQ
jgi:4-carboxymuconolactone decarboxylase